jgi:hypothetical protein
MATSDDTKIHKHPFTLEEDKILLHFVVLHGPQNWRQLASILGNRSAKQCRERWNNQLNPAINRNPWTRFEDRILAERHAMLGNHWAKIARFLPGRTDTQVKNRWSTSIKGRVSDFGAERQFPMIGEAAIAGPLQSWLNLMDKGGARDPSFVDWMTIPPLRGADV